MNPKSFTLTADFQRIKARWPLLTPEQCRLMIQFADQLISETERRRGSRRVRMPSLQPKKKEDV